MKLTVLEIKEIIKLGSGLNLDVADFSVMNLKNFAKIAEKSGVTITIYNAEKLNVIDLKNIAKLGAGKVIFNFSKEEE